MLLSVYARPLIERLVIATKVTRIARFFVPARTIATPMAFDASDTDPLLMIGL